MDRMTTLVWDSRAVDALLSDVHLRQGWLFGRLSMLAPSELEGLSTQTMAHEVIASASIEGTELAMDAVTTELGSFGRGDFSFITTALDENDAERRQVAAAVDVAFDSTAGCFIDVTLRRLAKWHEVLFAAGQAGSRRAEPGQYRKSRFEDGPSEELMAQMGAYTAWLNAPPTEDLLLKGAISHLAGFLIRPFATGNGRIIRALSELLLMQADVTAADKLVPLLDDGEGPALLYRLRSLSAASIPIKGLPPRFYSLSPYILENLSGYKAEIVKVRDALRDADPDEPFECDITDWIVWYLTAVQASIETATGLVPTFAPEAAPSPSPSAPEKTASETQTAKPKAPKSAPNRAPAPAEAPAPPPSLTELPLSVRQADVLAILAAAISAQGDAANHVSTGKWAELCDVSTDTALRDITDLVKKGVLAKDARRSGRSTFYRITDGVLADLQGD